MRDRGFKRLLSLLLCVVIFAPAAEAAGRHVVPEFSLTLKELNVMVSPLPKAIQEGILSRPDAFLHLVARVLDEPADLLVLVDKNHPLPEGYEPADLVVLASYGLSVSRKDHELREAIMPAVLAMDGAARAAGVTLLFSSTYRSYSYQMGTYDREVKAYGREVADREVAKPGMSQHQLGTAIDFGSITDAFAATTAGKWLAAHAGEYGFSLSFPQGMEGITGYRWECWHYRYITKVGVQLQKAFFGDVQQFLLEFLNDNRRDLEAKRLKPS